MPTDQLLASIAQALARLAVDVDHDQVLVVEEERVHRMVDKRPEARLARAELVLGLPQLRDVLHDAELA
jgi:hypothetical protein